MNDRPSLLAQLGRAFDGLRRLLVNVVFFGLLVVLAVAAWQARPRVPRGAALVVQPRGIIVEQLSGGEPVQRLLAQISGAPPVRQETLLRDLLDAIRSAKDDRRISSLYLELDDMSGAGMTVLRDLRAGLLDFRKSGKKVVAYADGYAQPQYYLAAQADEVYLHPQGLVLLEGFGRWLSFYKEGLDRLGVDVHVFRVGKYKSAVEPFTRTDMSPAAKEMSLDFYGDLWSIWLDDVATSRKLQPRDVVAMIDGYPERLREAGGDTARMALEAKLVDKLAPRDEVRKRMIELAGEDKSTKSFRQVDVDTYLAAQGGDRTSSGKGDAVAIVVARGEILDGSQPPGTIGGDSTAALIRRARLDDTVKGVVLRVDSPGGSAFAAEVIRRECELVRLAGKPLVVSMGNVAASGGYWISTASDEIWASPATITGSIGIFAIFPTVDRPLARYLGIHTDGVGTTPFSDILRADRPLDPKVGDLLQQAIDFGYKEFVAHVSEARHMTPEQVDDIAQGRVWSGEDAKRIGLVDHLGGLPQAIESAARRAKLGKTYRVFYVEKEKSLLDRVAGLLVSVAAPLARSSGILSSSPPGRLSPSTLAGRLEALRREADRLARWNDPRGIYAHCLCGEE
jgi:protease-4